MILVLIPTAFKTCLHRQAILESKILLLVDILSSFHMVIFNTNGLNISSHYEKLRLNLGYCIQSKMMLKILLSNRGI